jgi:hypothetical protein
MAGVETGIRGFAFVDEARELEDESRALRADLAVILTCVERKMTAFRSRCPWLEPTVADLERRAALARQRLASLPGIPGQDGPEW